MCIFLPAQLPPRLVRSEVHPARCAFAQRCDNTKPQTSLTSHVALASSVLPLKYGIVLNTRTRVRFARAPSRAKRWTSIVQAKRAAAQAFVSEYVRVHLVQETRRPRARSHFPYATSAVPERGKHHVVCRACMVTQILVCLETWWRLGTCRRPLCALMYARILAHVGRCLVLAASMLL